MFPQHSHIPPSQARQSAPSGALNCSGRGEADTNESDVRRVTTSTAVVPVPSQVLRALGRRTRSMSLRSSGSDRIFNVTGAPPNFRNTNLDRQIYRIRQTNVADPFTSSTTVSVAYSLSFNLHLMNQSATLQSLFDQYRLVKVEVWVTPRNSTAASATANHGRLVTVVDYDDANALPDIPAALEYQNALISSGLDGHYRCFRPHCAVAAYQGAFTGYANVASPWIDSASPGVQHFGFKAMISPTDQPYTFDVQYRTHWEFRNAI